MDLFYTFLGVSIGIFLAYLFLVFKRKRVIRNDAEIVMTNIKRVSKLITVEGEFSEVYQHRHKGDYFFKILKSEKKAIVIVKAKVLMGYNLDKMKFTIDEIQKKIIINQKPEIEILHLSTEMEYFDIKNGTLNRFSKDELNEIKEDAREFMVKKIHDSDLPKLALEQGSEGIKLIEQTSESLGWKLIHK
ncbi:MAG: DUF4230 domain-containing protein [Flavobacteriales bacterium]|nr:DUF4230 domain-containing protein [Flavobacteriales bacterium]